MNSSERKGIFLAILAATLYALNAPFSKLLLAKMPSTLMAGFLYIGAGLAMVLILSYRKIKHQTVNENRLTKKDLPFVIMMILLDIAAPICLLVGLSKTTAANASLLNNFEIVATSCIAFIFFKERTSKKMLIGIILVTLSCCILSFENISAFSFSVGSLFVLLAASFWGLENNCTRQISDKDPLEIVLLKGIFSGGGSIIIGLVIGERVNDVTSIVLTMILGAVAYGLSIFFYVYSQRVIGAAKTSVFYSFAPFISTILSLFIFKEIPTSSYFLALIIMLIGAYLCAEG